MGTPPFSEFAPPAGDTDGWPTPAIPTSVPPPAMTPPEAPSAPQQPAAPPTYPPGYYPYVASFVDPSAPGTVFLEIPGAAAPVYVIHADDGHPELYFGARKATAASFSGAVTVPLLDGTRARIKWVESWTGFPVATYQGRTVFSLPMPPGADRFVMVLVRVFPLVLGLIPGYFMGIGLARWMAGMIKRGEPTAKRRLAPLAVALSPILLGAIFIAAIALAAANGEGY